MEHKPRDEKAADRARTLRRDSTAPEQLLWGLLRNRRLGGWKFRRQKPMSGHIVDYCCVEGKLIVELDGMTHVGRGVLDDRRTRVLERDGYRVLRVTNDDVIEDRIAVAEYIMAALGGPVSGKNCAPSHSKVPSPQPSPGGRGGRK